MLKVFFPITGLFFDPLLIFSTGLFGGFISGFLGVGCGVIITPVLMKFGIPPLIAISTQLCHAVGTNLASFLSYKRKRDVDFHLATYILLGGFLGAACEWILLKYSEGSRAVVSKFIYVYIFVLFVFGIIMLTQSIKEWINGTNNRHGSAVMMRRWMLYLPAHKIFIRSRAEMSIIIPLAVGFLAGLLVASLGGGNNLFMAPIITYLIGRISPVVNGTTALAGWVITAVVSIVYSENGYCCDMLFVLLLFIGASLGSFIGVNLTYNIKRYYINAMAAMVVFIMASWQAFNLYFRSFASMSTKTANLSNSFIFELAKESTIIYTMICVILISVAAIVFEKVLQVLSEKGKNMKIIRRKK